MHMIDQPQVERESVDIAPATQVENTTQAVEASHAMN
jgi:hypothetical protein